jgi:YgiT-type zinc finger domain-containing protein
MTASLSKCARCASSDLEDTDIEKLVRGGDDVVAVRVRATTCRHCGERYFSSDTVRVLEQARHDLAEGKLGRFRTVGRLLALPPDTGR